MGKQFDTLFSFISRPDAGHGKRISVIEKRLSGYIILYGNAHYPGKTIKHGDEVALAYLRRDWQWFEDNEKEAAIESSPNNRR